MVKKKHRSITAREKKLLKVAKFLLKFNLYAIPLYIILLSGWALPEFQRATANITYALLKGAGASPTIDGFMISIPVNNGTWAALINWDCTGWKSILAFFALVMATDLPGKRKLMGLLLIPVVYVANIARIFFMFFYVRTFDLANYQLVHTVIWSWGLIITILVLWIIWLRYDFGKIVDAFQRL